MRYGLLALDKPKLDNLASDIWKSAERLRGKFKAYEFQNVILPIIVLRRLECVLVLWREAKAAEVLANRPNMAKAELAQLVKGLEVSGAPFSNTTSWTLRKEAPVEAHFEEAVTSVKQLEAKWPRRSKGSQKP